MPIAGQAEIFDQYPRECAARPLRESFLFGLFLFVIACVSSLTIYAQASRVYQKQLRQEIMRLAVLFSTAVDGDSHEKFVTPEQEQGADYQNAIMALRKLWIKVPEIKFVYTTVLKNGRVYFVLDATPYGDADGDGIEDHSKIMDLYEDPDPQLVRALKENAPMMSLEPYTDKWGTFLSAYVPVYNSEKKAAGVLGADMKLEEYSRQVWNLQKTAFYGLIIPLLCGGVSGFIVYFLRKRAMLAEKARWAVQQDLIKAKQAAESANAAKSRFLANMSHEIRTPLNAILGFSDLLRESKMDDEQKVFLDTILQSGELLLEIINDILDVSKIEAGLMTIETVPFSPADVAVTIVNIAKTKLKNKSTQVYSSVAADVPAAVLGDPTRIQQILLNFLSNAVKFTKAGKIEVEVACLPEKSSAGTVWLSFSVTDTGIGIPKDKQKLIFQPFQQADSSTTRKYGGSGLGLTIAQNLINLMQGKLSLESEEGKGSCFRFEIPFKEVSGEKTDLSISKDSKENFNLNGIRVLVAEDNPINQHLMDRMLSRLGCRVDVVDNGREAVESMASKHYDLCFMDLQMPEMGGAQAAEVIRKKKNHTPIIALTASIVPEDKAACLAAGMNDFLSKPVEAGKLRAIIEKWIKLS